MRSIVSGLLILALLVVIVLDGTSLFLAYSTAKEVASAAAEQAALEYVVTRGNVDAATAVAETYAGARNTELLSVHFGGTDHHYSEVSVRALPHTRLFQHIPGVRDYLDQESTALVQF